MVPSSLNEPCTLGLPTPLRPYTGNGDSGMWGTVPVSGARFRSNRKSAPLPTGILPHIKRNPAPLPVDSMPHFDRNPQRCGAPEGGVYCYWRFHDVHSKPQTRPKSLGGESLLELLLRSVRQGTICQRAKHNKRPLIFMGRKRRGLYVSLHRACAYLVE
jgi:hypothetical protein